MLTVKCQFYLIQDLALSTRRVYASAQHQFMKFRHKDGQVNGDNSNLPALERTLICFNLLFSSGMPASQLHLIAPCCLDLKKLTHRSLDLSNYLGFFFGFLGALLFKTFKLIQCLAQLVCMCVCAKNV